MKVIKSLLVSLFLSFFFCPIGQYLTSVGNFPRLHVDLLLSVNATLLTIQSFSTNCNSLLGSYNFHFVFVPAMIIKYNILFVFVILEQKQKRSYFSLFSFKPFSIWRRFERKKRQITIWDCYQFFAKLYNVWTIDR